MGPEPRTLKRPDRQCLPPAILRAPCPRVAPAGRPPLRIPVGGSGRAGSVEELPAAADRDLHLTSSSVTGLLRNGTRSRARAE